jgi:hypothetical protein
VQVTFSTQGLGVNGIPEREALKKALIQLVGAGLVVGELLTQSPLSLLEALGERMQLSPQGIDPLQGAGGGLSQTLATLHLLPLAYQLALQITMLSGIGILKGGQPLT